MKVWYQKESGKEIADSGAGEAAKNLIGFFEILAR